MSFKENATSKYHLQTVFRLTAREQKALENPKQKVFADEIFPAT